VGGRNRGVAIVRRGSSQTRPYVAYAMARSEDVQRAKAIAREMRGFRANRGRCRNGRRPPIRQNRASVFARSLLTAGSMQKSQPEPAALPDSRTSSTRTRAFASSRCCRFPRKPAITASVDETARVAACGQKQRPIPCGVSDDQPTAVRTIALRRFSWSTACERNGERLSEYRGRLPGLRHFRDG
jgi:hypothetical protein